MLSSGHSGGGPRDDVPSYLHVDVVLNPLSKAAQRVAPILEWLRSSFHASIKVKLGPVSELAPPDEHLVLMAFYQNPDCPSTSLQNFSWSVQDDHPSSLPSPEERLPAGSGLLQHSKVHNQAHRSTFQCQAAPPNDVVLQVYLNPERELSDMPLKTFYRYVLPEPSPAGEPDLIWNLCYLLYLFAVVHVTAVLHVAAVLPVNFC